MQAGHFCARSGAAVAVRAERGEVFFGLRRRVGAGAATFGGYLHKILANWHRPCSNFPTVDPL